MHYGEAEIFFVLRGSGLSWQAGKTYAVREGDCLIHRVYEEAHTLRGGPDGMEYLVFGQRRRGASAVLPRSGTMWRWPRLDRRPHGRDAVAPRSEDRAA